MSGTSMDGVDLICVDFYMNSPRCSYQILAQKTYKYETNLLSELSKAKFLNVPEILKLDKVLGRYFAEKINDFCVEFKLEQNQIHAIASHGHTVHHQPENGFTQQIGCGTTMAVLTNINVVNDFRSKDVVLKGQGAPLVPIGDKLLFEGRAESFINLGGFCNISFQGVNEAMFAFDICPCNLPLNQFSKALGKEFDFNGNFARSGKNHLELLKKLNDIAYYEQNGPKSLGTEFLERTFLPLVRSVDIPFEDLLSTITEHIAIQISKVLLNNQIRSTFLTGGGARNSYLIERISAHSKKVQIIQASDIEIEFKEALVFALLGSLYLRDIPNTLPSVTGSTRPCVGGVFHKFK